MVDNKIIDDLRMRRALARYGGAQPVASDRNLRDDVGEMFNRGTLFRGTTGALTGPTDIIQEFGRKAFPGLSEVHGENPTIGEQAQDALTAAGVPKTTTGLGKAGELIVSVLGPGAAAKGLGLVNPMLKAADRALGIGARSMERGALDLGWKTRPYVPYGENVKVGGINEELRKIALEGLEGKNIRDKYAAARKEVNYDKLIR